MTAAAQWRFSSQPTCTPGRENTNWPKFWSGIGIASAATLVYFFLSYRGQGGRGISRLTSTVEKAEG